MAGDWIKVETCTPSKPEVFKMARCLGVDRDAIVGKLIRFWAWLDQVCVDGYVDGLTSTDVDTIVGQVGFADALEEVNWVEFDLTDHGHETGFRVSNFGDHNGKSSKNRALKNKRQNKWRAKNVDGGPSTDPSTREEKRRVIDKSNDLSRSNDPKTGSNDPSVTQSRFDDFWSVYPKKVKKKACKTKWQSRKLDKQADRIIADIQTRAETDRRWLEGFIPDPTTYINGDLWEDEIEPARKPPTKVEINWKDYAKQHRLEAQPGESWDQYKIRIERTMVENERTVQ